MPNAGEAASRQEGSYSSNGEKPNPSPENTGERRQKLGIFFEQEAQRPELGISRILVTPNSRKIP